MTDGGMSEPRLTAAGLAGSVLVDVREFEAADDAGPLEPPWSRAFPGAIVVVTFAGTSLAVVIGLFFCGARSAPSSGFAGASRSPLASNIWEGDSRVSANVLACAVNRVASSIAAKASTPPPSWASASRRPRRAAPPFTADGCVESIIVVGVIALLSIRGGEVRAPGGSGFSQLSQNRLHLLRLRTLLRGLDDFLRPRGTHRPQHSRGFADIAQR